MAFLSAAMSSAQAPEDGYVFVIDGKTRRPPTFSLNGTPARRSAGDVVYIGEIPIVLDGPGTYRYRTTDRKDGRLFQIGDDGKESVVGASALSRLTDEEIGRLRGVRLDSWPEGTATRLERLDPSKAAVEITDNTHREGAMPPLPAGLRYLIVDESSNSGIRDFQALARQKDLRLFRASLMTARSFDVAHLKANAGLRILHLGSTSLENPGTIAAFPELRLIDLSWNDSLKDISWIRGMKFLVSLAIDQTGVEDLSPLEGLGAIGTVDADRSPVRTLPRGGIPTLTSLRIMGAKVSDADVAAFRRDNPQCKVAHRWAEALRDKFAAATRLRVRTGGTCHSNPDEEKTLFEEKDAKELQALVRSIVIDEPRSGFHCMCCGEPSFEFYAGEALLGTVGFHHGNGLRWSGGWPGDAALTPECADGLADWLAKRGVTGPKREREESRRRAAAQSRRWDRVKAIVSPELWEQMTAAKSQKDLRAALLAASDVKLCLRLYGSHDGSWNLEAGLDSAVKAILEETDGKTLSEAVAAVQGDPEGALGAARWVLNEKRGKELTPEVRARCLPAMARIGLSHSRAISRERTLYALLDLQDGAAVGPLKEVVNGTLVPRPVKEGDEDEPGGMVTAVPGDPEIPDGASSTAFAAYVLARLGDKSATARIRALREKAAASDAALLDKALRLIDTGK
jgi:hypothetical protein